MFDNSGGPSLELLRFSWRVTSCSEFETALRERVELLSRFQHQSFAKIRAVEVLAPRRDLTLVSNYVSGKRLSDSLATLRGPLFAEWLIREVVPVLADFQQHAPGLAHGALTGDRIVLTPGGRFVIVEHVLGSALQRLQLARNDLWLRFGIATPPASAASVVLDQQTDVFQLALLAVAVLMGRPLEAYEYPHHLAATLATFEQSTGRELPPSLQSWLIRALQLGGQPFESARDAQNSLGEFQAAPSNLALAGAGMSGAATQTVKRAERVLLAAEQSLDDEAGLRSATDVTNGARKAAAEPRAQPFAESEDFTRARQQMSSQLLHRYSQPRTGFRDYLLAVFAGIVVAQTGYIAYSAYLKPPAIVVQAPQDSPPSKTEPPTPAQSLPQSPPAPPLVLQALTAEPRQPAATAPSAQPVRSGGVRILSSFDLQVFEGDRVLGSSAGGPIVASAGRHELELVHNALGYRTRRVVTLRAGEVVSLSVPHPDGRISINATPWADVWIDGAHVGETPLANLPIPIGQHEVTFRHPVLGEQRRTAIVRFDSPARVSADLR